MDFQSDSLCEAMNASAVPHGSLGTILPSPVTLPVTLLVTWTICQEKSNSVETRRPSFEAVCVMMGEVLLLSMSRIDDAPRQREISAQIAAAIRVSRGIAGLQNKSY